MDSNPLHILRRLLARMEAEARALTGRLRDTQLTRVRELTTATNNICNRILEGNDDGGMHAVFSELLVRIEEGFRLNREEIKRIVGQSESQVASRERASASDQPRAQFPKTCPWFEGPHPVARTSKSRAPGSDEVIKWGRVMDNVTIPADPENQNAPNSSLVEAMKTWVKSSGCWHPSRPVEEKTGWLMRCHCRFGWEARQYKKRLHAGSKTAVNPESRGFAKPDSRFENCCAEMRIHFIPGKTILFIEVRLRDDRGCVHTHGNPIAGVVVTPALVKLDPTLATLNELTSTARDIGIPPGAVLGESLNRLTEFLTSDFSTVMRALTSTDGKVDTRKHVAKVRGQNKPITVEHLYKLQDRQQAVYEASPDKRHIPRVIGVSYSCETGQKPHFAFTVSTDAMLEAAETASLHKLVVATDCTFKRVRVGVVLTIGAIDRCGHYRFLCLSLTSGECAKSYERVFEHLKRNVEACNGYEFKPKYLMGDASQCLNGVYRILSTEVTKRLNCYSHFMKSAFTSVTYTFGLREHWAAFRDYLRILARARSREQFCMWLNCFKERAKTEFPARIKSYIETSPYFQPENAGSHWYWCTSKGMEDVWKVRTNNGNEGSNGRLRSQVFRNIIQSLNTGIEALLSNQLTVLSYEADQLKLEQRVDTWKEEWKLVAKNRATTTTQLVAPDYNFRDPAGAYRGDTYAVNCESADEIGLLATGMYDPFANGAPQGYLTFIPARDLMPTDLSKSPLENGPVCCCDTYASKLRCYHICLLLATYRGLDLSPNRSVISDGVDGHRTNVPRLPPKAALKRIPPADPALKKRMKSKHESCNQVHDNSVTEVAVTAHRPSSSSSALESVESQAIVSSEPAPKKRRRSKHESSDRSRDRYPEPGAGIIIPEIPENSDIPSSSSNASRSQNQNQSRQPDSELSESSDSRPSQTQTGGPQSIIDLSESRNARPSKSKKQSRSRQPDSEPSESSHASLSQTQNASSKIKRTRKGRDRLDL